MDVQKLSFVQWISWNYGSLWTYFDLTANDILTEYSKYLNENE